MIAIALMIAFGCFGMALLLCLYRVVRGPTITDRLVGLDTMAINVIALLTLFGVHHGTHIYFEVSMLVALFGFVSTVAYTKYVLRGDIIE